MCSLHRKEASTQPQIGRLNARHKSWVSRRLLPAEGLGERVQADVRLGLVVPASTAAAVARLPRRNQRTAADAVMNRGLPKHQTERLVRFGTSRRDDLRWAATRAGGGSAAPSARP